MATGTFTVTDQRVFRIFISYASEDLAIATAVASCFKTALPDFFAEINIDRDFLEPGSAFKTQIESKLQQTDVLVIVYTGAEKASHGYTGWEVGYFDHIMRTDPGHRKKISLYLFEPPAITAYEQGISLGLSTSQLRVSLHDFESVLSVSPEEALCSEIAAWQDEVAKNIEKTGFPKPHRKPEQEPAKCVHNLKLAIFQYLKGTVENTVKPQKQITVRVRGSALEESNETLPMEAELRPLGAVNTGGSMKIFGLADEPITWKRFVELTAGQPFAESWQDAIIADLAWRLASLTILEDHVVVDKTGLTARYDFDLEWAPDETQFGGDVPNPSADTPASPLFTAIQEQLGLRLVATRGPVDALIIDTAERPSAN